MTTEERLEMLERELARAKRRVRRLVIAGTGTLVCAAVLVAAWTCMPEVQAQGQAPIAELVRARKFVLVDENGRERAMLDAGKERPGLRLYDENGKERVWLDADKERPGLTLYDENGGGRAWLSVGKDGLGLGLYDENGKRRAILGVGKEGPGLCLSDKNGKKRAMLEVDDDEDVPGLSLYGKNRLRAGLYVGKDWTDLSLYDENGKSIWKAP